MTAVFSPLYQQIKQLLVQNLQQGQWKPGESIPSEMDLALQFQVSQGTVRKAIDELAAEHMLVRRQGKGTFVATHSEQHVQYRFLRLVPDAIGEAKQANSEGPAQRQILSCQHVAAEAAIAKPLGLYSGDEVVHLVRTLAFEGVPTILEHIWLPGHVFKGLDSALLTADPSPMYSMFESRYGVSMVRAEEKLRAVAADAEQAEALGVALGTPLLSVERLSYSYGDQPMELRHAWYHTEKHHYRNPLQ